MVGSALVPALQSAGHSVTRLVRSRPQAGEILWDPTGALTTADLEGFDTVVHLAGENIAGRWTHSKKSRILHSRVQGTQVLANSLTRLRQPPRALVSASAIGYYGDRGDEPLTETSSSGSGFLADVARRWEGATEPASRAGVRVVNLRIGVVLSARGGALAKMLPPFRMGVGGRVGTGRQYWSWITLDDLVGVIQHALITEALRGPVNTVSPSPVTNAEFTRILGQVLSRPTVLPMPAFVVRLIFGQMGQELLLASQRVDSTRLQSSGYRFLHPDLKSALEHLLKH